MLALGEINVGQTQLSQAQIRESCHFNEQAEALVASTRARAIEEFPGVIVYFFCHTTPSGLDSTGVIE